LAENRLKSTSYVAPSIGFLTNGSSRLLAEGDSAWDGAVESPVVSLVCFGAGDWICCATSGIARLVCRLGLLERGTGGTMITACERRFAVCQNLFSIFFANISLF